jgi:hypothetical protein
MKRTKLTHEQHLVLATQLISADETLRDAFFTNIQPAFGKSHPASKALLKVIKTMQVVRSELDTEYHNVTSQEQYMKEGHVYYKWPTTGDKYVLA